MLPASSPFQVQKDATARIRTYCCARYLLDLSPIEIELNSIEKIRKFNLKNNEPRLFKYKISEQLKM